MECHSSLITPLYLRGWGLKGFFDKYSLLLANGRTSPVQKLVFVACCNGNEQILGTNG